MVTQTTAKELNESSDHMGTCNNNRQKFHMRIIVYANLLKLETVMLSGCLLIMPWR